MGPQQSPQCQENLLAIEQLCNLLGIPLATEKVEGPTDSLTFLGITLDTKKMEARLPADKLQRINWSHHGFRRKEPLSVKYCLSLGYFSMLQRW